MSPATSVVDIIKTPNGHEAKRVRKTTTSTRISNGDKHLEWVRISDMKISERSQRRHDTPSSVAKIVEIAENFDPDKAGTLTVNLRNGVYWVIDGGHRYHAFIRMGWEDQQVQCWQYDGLSEAEEADKFLALNDVKQVSGMDKFKRAVVAKHPTECDIDRIVRAADLTVGTNRDALGCVGALQKIYLHHGPDVLATALRIIRDSFGIPGFTSKITEGTGIFVGHYGKSFNEEMVISRLASKKGGVVGLMGEAERIRIKYGVTSAVAVAAAIVETYNRGRGGVRLASWWASFGGSH